MFRFLLQVYWLQGLLLSIRTLLHRSDPVLHLLLSVFWLNVIFTSSVDGVQGALVIVQRSTYVVPAVPVKVLVGLVGAVNCSAYPLTILHAPVPTAGVLAARVAVVNPHIDAPV